MCKEMGEQMSLLQSTAMARIESLEAELLQERREKEEIEVRLRLTKQADMMKSLKRSVIDAGRKSDSSDDTECTNSTEEINDEDDDEGDGTPTKQIDDTVTASTSYQQVQQILGAFIF